MTTQTDPTATGRDILSDVDVLARLLDYFGEQVRSLNYLDTLTPTRRNIISATEAYARITAQGWQPITGYPGSDSPWTVLCLVCGEWAGQRFYSHLRRGKPAMRHPGCLPTADQAARIEKLNADASIWCDCTDQHPTTADEIAALMTAMDQARTADDTTVMPLMLGRLLDPCTATARRAAAMRDYANRVNMQAKAPQHAPQNTQKTLTKTKNVIE